MAHDCVPVGRTGRCLSHLPDPALRENMLQWPQPPGPRPEAAPRGCAFLAELKGSARDPGGTRWRLWAPYCRRPELPYLGPRWSLGWPASTHSIRLQPWTGSLFPQKPADSTVSPLGTRVPRGALGWEVTCPPDAAQEEHGLASGCGLNLSANVSADTNALSNPLAALSQCLHGSCVEPAFRACLGARRPLGETPGSRQVDTLQKPGRALRPPVHT